MDTELRTDPVIIRIEKCSRCSEPMGPIRVYEGRKVGKQHLRGRIVQTCSAGACHWTHHHSDVAYEYLDAQHLVARLLAREKGVPVPKAVARAPLRLATDTLPVSDKPVLCANNCVSGGVPTKANRACIQLKCRGCCVRAASLAKEFGSPREPCNAHYVAAVVERTPQAQTQQGLGALPSLQPQMRASNETNLRPLMDHELTTMVKDLTDCMQDAQKYSKFLALRGQEAQSSLNQLQAFLDFPRLDPSLRRPFLHVLLQLSRASGLYPECLVLKGIQQDGFLPNSSGSFGDVWTGEVRGQGIAIKVLKMYQTGDAAKHFKDFCREAIIWRQLCHANIVPCFGIYHWHGTTPKVCLISPWMNNGNVTQYLGNFPDADGVRLSLDVAEGLEYLHSMDIVHGDLKGENILVTPSGRACLADFGLSNLLDSQSVSTSSPLRGTLRWQAPELLRGECDRANSCTDIYSFACVCYEFFSGNIPFYDLGNGKVYMEVFTGSRPSRPTGNLCLRRGLDDEMWYLIQTCWQSDPSERPTAGEVVTGLRSRPNLALDERGPPDWDYSSISMIRLAMAEYPVALFASSSKQSTGVVPMSIG